MVIRIYFIKKYFGGKLYLTRTTDVKMIKENDH